MKDKEKIILNTIWLITKRNTRNLKTDNNTEIKVGEFIRSSEDLEEGSEENEVNPSMVELKLQDCDF